MQIPFSEFSSGFETVFPPLWGESPPAVNTEAHVIALITDYTTNITVFNTTQSSRLINKWETLWFSSGKVLCMG